MWSCYTIVRIIPPKYKYESKFQINKIKYTFDACLSELVVQDYQNRVWRIVYVLVLISSYRLRVRRFFVHVYFFLLRIRLRLFLSLC